MPNHFKRIVSKVLSKSKPLHVSFSFYNLRLEFSHFFFFSSQHLLMIKFTNLSDLWYFMLPRVQKKCETKWNHLFSLRYQGRPLSQLPLIFRLRSKKQRSQKQEREKLECISDVRRYIRIVLFISLYIYKMSLNCE